MGLGTPKGIYEVISVGDTAFNVDAMQVRLDRARADDQLAGDVLGVVALQQQREHLLLAPRQLMGIGIDHHTRCEVVLRACALGRHVLIGTRMTGIHAQDMAKLAKELDRAYHEQHVFGDIALGQIPQKEADDGVLRVGAAEQNHVGVLGDYAKRKNEGHLPKEL